MRPAALIVRPGGRFDAVKARPSPSASAKKSETSKVTVWPSDRTRSGIGLAVGASLVAAMKIVTVAVSVPPLPSSIV